MQTKIFILKSFIIFFTIHLGSLFQLISQVINAKVLEIIEFGTLSIYITLFSFFGIFSFVVSKIYTKNFVIFLEKKDYLYDFHYKSSKILIYSSLIIIFFMFAFKNYIAGYLKIDNAFHYFIIILLIVINLFYQSGMSFFHAQKKYFMIGILSSLFPFLKVLISLIFVIFFFYNLETATIAFSISLVIVFLITYFIYFKSLALFDKSKKNKKLTSSKLINEFFYTFILSMSFGSILYIDQFIVRDIFSLTEFSQFAAYSSFSKMIFYLTSPITILVLPEAVLMKSNDRIILLIKSLIVVFMISLFAGLFMYSFDFQIFKYLFDLKYYVNKDLSLFMILSMSLYGLTNIINMMALALSFYKISIIYLLCLSVFILLVYFFKINSLITFSIFLTLFNLIVVILSFIFIYNHIKKPFELK